MVRHTISRAAIHVLRVSLLSQAFFPIAVSAKPTIVEYAKCSGILVVAAALTEDTDPSKSSIYMQDAGALQTKASKLKGYDKGTYMEMSFDSSGDYMEMLKRGAASKTDFWSDVGYCRGLAQ